MAYFCTSQVMFEQFLEFAVPFATRQPEATARYDQETKRWIYSRSQKALCAMASAISQGVE